MGLKVRYIEKVAYEEEQALTNKQINK